MVHSMRAVRAYVESFLTLDGTLDSKERFKRSLFFFFPLFGFAFMAIPLVMRRKQYSVQLVPLLLNSAACLLLLAAPLVVAARIPLTNRLIAVFMYLSSIAILVGDLHARTLGGTRWPLMMLLIDFMLVMQAPSKFTMGLVGLTIVWLCVMAGEEVFRFGLFDMPGLMPQEGEYGRKEYYRKLTDCAGEIPCQARFPPGNFILSLAVFIIDFFATRGFARDVLKEQASMAQTISTVQEIASLLAGYDVEKVAELLAAHGTDLPEGMLLALSTLEANLRVYKAYLPQTCLQQDPKSPKDGVRVRDRSESIVCSESSSSTVSRTSSLGMMKSTRAQALGLSTVNGTLLTLNIKNTMRILEEDSTRYSQLFTSVLVRILGATDSQQGMVDVFIGDRIHCSFNTSKRCASHATCALSTAAALVRSAVKDTMARFNIGIATGKVLRGDMGCEMMRRFSMIGTLVRDVNGMERAGRILGCDVLCNRLCFSDGELEHQLRLIPRKVEVDAGCDEEVVAELVVKEGNIDISIADEWMYMIGGKKDWDAYNSSVRAYFKGEASAADVAAAAYEANAGKKQAPARMFAHDYTTLRLSLRSMGNHVDNFTPQE